MGSNKSKEMVPIEYGDGTVGCAQMKTKTTNTKSNKSNCCPDPCLQQNMQTTHTTIKPMGEPVRICGPSFGFHGAADNIMISNPSNPHIPNYQYDHLQTLGVPQPGPVYVGGGPHMPLVNPYVDDGKVSRLFQEFLAISGNGHAIDFNSFRLLFLSALCKIDFKSANEFALSTFAQFDTNRDGYIDFNEFLNGYQILDHEEKSHFARVLPGSAHLFADSLPNIFAGQQNYSASPYSNRQVRFTTQVPTTKHGPQFQKTEQIPESHGHQVEHRGGEQF